MPFTLEEIVALKNPYEVLGNGDALAENRIILNELAEEDQRQIASRIVLDCPEAEFRELGYAINALSPKSAFYQIIRAYFHIKSMIQGLYDVKNNAPYQLVLSPDFNSLFLEYYLFSTSLLDEHKTNIAQRLALTTPAEKCNRVVQTMMSIFPGALIASEVSAAFTLRREINQLFTDQPWTFFTSFEFNEDSCKRFPELFRTISPKYQAITIQMEKAPVEKRDAVLAQMKTVFSETMSYLATNLSPVRPQRSTFFQQQKPGPADEKSTYSNGLS